ncbi:hypothetical protein FCJ61_40385 [Burkholderia metallica]|uniref:glucoamylase family protein n=1 Tax=Burkholderia metallica TaxID=488729 RepID=UPI00157A85D4|nr:glucoamylase family protein [Burkholderia metallica]NTZ89058.1 hypothetical protein [Burkholderia metallica]
MNLSARPGETLTLRNRSRGSVAAVAAIALALTACGGEDGPQSVPVVDHSDVTPVATANDSLSHTNHPSSASSYDGSEPNAQGFASESSAGLPSEPATSDANVEAPDSTEALRIKTEAIRYARSTWNSIQLFAAESSIPADKVCFSKSGQTQPVDYTFITNIAAYAWSIIGARDLGFISDSDAYARLDTLVAATEKLQQQSTRAGAPGGMLLWAAKVAEPKIDGELVSSVDNGWLAAGLGMIAQAYPSLERRAQAIIQNMDFRRFLDDSKGQFYHNYDMSTSKYSAGTYDLLTEARIISYVGIGEHKIPPSQYFRIDRTPSWWLKDNTQQMHVYDGIQVYETTKTYQSYRYMPSWGGSMFETFMPAIIFDEAKWGERSWGRSHPQMASAQVAYGLSNFGFWGFSPSQIPSGNGMYGEFGAPPMGYKGDGYSPHGENQQFRAGPVVTPHAIFLLMEYRPAAAIDMLNKMKFTFPAMFSEDLGFRDSVDIKNGTVSNCILMLDQAMSFGAAVNFIKNGQLKKYLDDRYGATLAAVLSKEEFWYPETTR